MKWISVKDGLPVIPEGRFGITVIVATWDSIYAEISGNGYEVYDAHYGPTKNIKLYGPNSPEFDFQTLYYGNCDSYWGPTGDPVTHWMYMPDPPKIEKKKKKYWYKTDIYECVVCGYEFKIKERCYDKKPKKVEDRIKHHEQICSRHY